MYSFKVYDDSAGFIQNEIYCEYYKLVLIFFTYNGSNNVRNRLNLEGGGGSTRPI